MEKRICIAICIAMLLALCACGAQPAAPAQDTAAAPEPVVDRTQEDDSVETEPEWQDPVMNFIGEYQCDRASATVESVGNGEARITIEWGGSAWELARWDITGRLDPETLTVEYSGVTKSIVTYGDNGEIVSQVPEYDDGTGTIAFHDDGTFTWHEDQSEYGTDMLFEWVPTDPSGSAADRQDGEGTISDEQALSAIESYCYAENPDLEGIVNAGEYTVYWEIASSDGQEIVVLFRSYTGAQIRYYIDRASGETYVTEFVPGIFSEEERTDESFNVRDYL